MGMAGMRAIAFTSPFVATALVSCATPTSQAADERLACLVLTHFVEAEFKSAEKPLQLSSDNVSDRRLQEQSGTNTRLVPGSFRPVTDCPGIAAIKREYSFEPKNPDAYPETTEDGLFFVYNRIGIGLPFIDPAATRIRFPVARQCGPMCASGAIVTYRRDESGEWKKEGERSTWIS